MGTAHACEARRGTHAHAHAHAHAHTVSVWTHHALNCRAPHALQAGHGRWGWARAARCAGEGHNAGVQADGAAGASGGNGPWSTRSHGKGSKGGWAGGPQSGCCDAGPTACLAHALGAAAAAAAAAAFPIIMQAVSHVHTGGVQRCHGQDLTHARMHARTHGHRGQGTDSVPHVGGTTSTGRRLGRRPWAAPALGGLICGG